MGVLVFKWGDGMLTTVRNRNNWEKREAKAAERNFIWRCWQEPDAVTWVGCSQGRVAFLVDGSHSDHASCELLSDQARCRTELMFNDFLKGTMTPSEFGNKLSEDEDASKKLVYHLLVADIITTKKVVCVSKYAADQSKVDIQEISTGLHTLSLKGIDHQDDHNLKIIEASTYECLASQKEVKFHGTTSTTAFVVKPTGEMIFFERYFENNEWKSQKIEYNIV